MGAERAGRIGKLNREGGNQGKRGFFGGFCHGNLEKGPKTGHFPNVLHPNVLPAQCWISSGGKKSPSRPPAGRKKISKPSPPGRRIHASLHKFEGQDQSGPYARPMIVTKRAATASPAATEERAILASALGFGSNCSMISSMRRPWLIESMRRKRRSSRSPRNSQNRWSEPIVLLFVRLIVSVFNNCIHHLASSHPLVASNQCPCAGVGACAFAGLCSAIKTMKTMTQIKIMRIKFPTDLTTQSPGLSVP